jgi:HPr kinase/phosphorylase
MSIHITTQDVYETFKDSLKLQWLLETETTKVLGSEDKKLVPRPNLIGYLNLIRPNRIQVLGATEIQYLESLDPDIAEDTFRQLFNAKPSLIIFACDTKPSPQFQQTAQTTNTPLLYSPLTANRIIEVIGFFLRSILSDKETLHGVFMEVMGLGVLITGTSGVGKSELALELLSRGHRLIADDAPEFFQASPDIIHGRCPRLLSNFIEVRGLGILNVSAMFGHNAILTEKQLSLIVKLEADDDIKPDNPIERLGCTPQLRKVLDVDIPEVVLPIGPGRNMAVIIEASVRNHALHLRGYNAAEDFIERQREMINKNNS